MKRRIKLPYWANWIISIALFTIIFITFYGLVTCVLFYSSNMIQISMTSMIYLMYLFCGVSFIGGYVIHGWLEIETISLKEDRNVTTNDGNNSSDSGFKAAEKDM